MAGGIPNSVLRLSETVFPWWSSLELTEEIGPVGSPETFRTVNGRFVVADTDPLELWKVSLASAGEATVFMPAFDGWHVGKEVLADCLTYFTAQILPGATSVILARDAVPDYIICRTEQTNMLIPHVYNPETRAVTVPVPLIEPISVVYRLRLGLVVTELPTTDTGVQKSTQGWTIVMEEQGDL